MKKLIIASAIVLLISVNNFAQSYGLGNTDPSVFSKYRIPETSLHSLWLNSQFNYSSSNNINSYQYHVFPSIGEAITNSTFNYNINASLSPSYYLLFENEDRVFSLDVSLDGAYSYNSTKQSEQIKDKDNEVTTLESHINSSYYKYFSSSDMFLSASASLFADINTNYKNETDYWSADVYSGSKDQNYIISFGFGLGRIRNVTSVVSAIRLQERLKQLNLLNNDLDESTIINLAQQFSRLDYYSGIYNRSNKYFWQDIENVLAKQNVSLKGLNMYGSNYLQEVNNEVRFNRREGLTASINMLLKYYNHYTSSEYAASKINEQLYFMGNAFVDYSHQLNLNSQISSSLFLSGGPGLIDNSNLRQQYSVTFKLRYDYEISDRLVTSVYNNANLEFTNINFPNYQTRVFEEQFNIALNYFIEDHIAVSSTYQWNYEETRAYFGKYKLCHNSIRLGLTYYFDRGFMAK